MWGERSPYLQLVGRLTGVTTMEITVQVPKTKKAKIQVMDLHKQPKEPKSAYHRCLLIHV